MRSNIVTESGLPTRLGQWWEGIPFLTSAVVITCGTIYLICLLTGYDSFHEICFLPSEVVSRFQVYRIYTSIVFHGSLLHVFFNMLALVPLGAELERLMGSVRLLYIIVLLATCNAVFHLFIALLADHNPFHSYHLMDECSIGFSGVLFSLIVIETSLSGIQSRSVFGLFNVPAKWYAWILLVAFQLLMSNVSLLGHLSGILSGFAYTYGLFNYLIPGTSFYSAIEASSLLSTCVRRPKFIMCTGGNATGYIPTYSNQNAPSGGSIFGNLWRNLSARIPQWETSVQSTQDSGFPGRGRMLGSERGQMVSSQNSDYNLQARLLDNNGPEHTPGIAPVGSGQQLLDGRNLENTFPMSLESHLHDQASVVSDEEVQKLVSMGFDRTQVEVAVAAADGDLNIAVEILMSQQG
ncbi:hypothetical protein NL676_001810 [Syzygium grande]|nr:hypothetical protein NL676_001810 [Syzygium grande]